MASSVARTTRSWQRSVPKSGNTGCVTWWTRSTRSSSTRYGHAWRRRADEEAVPLERRQRSHSHDTAVAVHFDLVAVAEGGAGALDAHHCRDAELSGDDRGVAQHRADV